MGSVPRRFSTVVASMLAWSFALACSAGGTAEAPPGEPTVTEAQPATVREGDLRELPRTEPWRAGDSVREVGDLRQTGYPDARVSLQGDRLTVVDGEGRPLATQPAHELWREVGGPCARVGDLPPALAADLTARRWIVARLVPEGDAASHACLAVSRPPDPITGGWLLYGFAVPAAAATPHLALSDADVTLSGKQRSGRYSVSLSRQALYAGDALRPRYFAEPGDAVQP